MTDEKIIQIIQALLEKTVQNGCTQAEAELASSKVSELLTKYNLDISRIEPIDTKVDIVEEGSDFLGLKLKPQWMIDLAGYVADFCYCELLVSRAVAHVYFVGRKENAKVAVMTFRALVLSLRTLGEQKTREFVENYKQRHNGFSPRWNYGGTSPTSWRLSFLKGASVGIRDSMRKQREEDIEKNTSVKTLVIHHDQENADYLSGMYPRLKMRDYTSEQMINGRAYQAGYQEGNSMSIPFSRKELSNG